MWIRALLALVAAAALLAGKLGIDARRSQQVELAPYDLGTIPQASTARWLSLGHASLAANLWWLRVVQYIGEPRGDARGWDKLHPAVDLVTDLDPKHGYAYQVGGNVLASVGRVDESNRILEKGMERLPERYILPFHRGVNAFLYAGDYVEAGRWFERAAQSSGAPRHMREAVAALYVKGNEADTAIAFLERMLAETSDVESRQALEKQLEQVRFERLVAPMDAASLRFFERTTRWPHSPLELVAAGLLDVIPSDPFGGAWVVDPEDGRWRSTHHERRLQKPLSEEERRRALQNLRDQTRGSQR